MKRSRKIAMKKRETRAQRAVSFSKRRYGLFNKAAELCLLSGAQIAMVVASPSSKESMFSFGHPSVDEVFDAFLHNRVPEAVDNEIKRSAISLFNEIKILEQEPKNSEKIDGFLRDFENLEKKFESIDDLRVVEEKLEKLKNNALNRLSNFLSSKSSASGSTSAATTNNDYEIGPGNINQGVIVKLENNKIYSGDVDYGICTGSGSNQGHVDENYVSGKNNIQDGDLRAITKSISKPEGYLNLGSIGNFGNNHVHNSNFSNGISTALGSDYVRPGENDRQGCFNFGGIGNFGNNHVHNSSFSDGISTPLASHYVHPGESNMYENDLKAITKYISNPEGCFNLGGIGNFGNNNVHNSNFNNGITMALASDYVHPGESNMYEGDLRAIAISFSNPEGCFSLGGIGNFSNNHVHNSSFNNGSSTALGSDYVHRGETNIHEGDLRAITKFASKPDFIKNPGDSTFYNSYVNTAITCASASAAASNVAYPDGNCMIGENINQEVEFGAMTTSVADPKAYFNQSLIGLEYTAQQHDSGNLLAMFTEDENKEFPLYSSANIDAINAAEFGHQNVYANFAEGAMPIAAVNQLGQLLSYDIPYFF